MHPPLSSKETALYSPRPDGQGSHRSISFSSPHENRFAGFSQGPRRSCRKRMGRARWKRKAPGASTRDCAGNFQSKRWARAQICVIFQLSARDELLSCVGVQDRLCLLLFPLPPGQRVAKRNVRGQKGAKSVNHPESPTPHAGKRHLCSPRPRRTRHKPPSLLRTVSPDPRTCPNLPKRAGFGHKAPFLLTVNGRLSPPKSRPNGRLAPTRACGRSLFGATEKKMGVHSPVPHSGGHHNKEVFP